MLKLFRMDFFLFSAQPEYHSLLAAVLLHIISKIRQRKRNIALSCIDDPAAEQPVSVNRIVPGIIHERYYFTPFIFFFINDQTN